jgi:hypothetical protein
MAATPSKPRSRSAQYAAVLVLGVIVLFVLAQGFSSTTPAEIAPGSTEPTAADDPDTLAPPGTAPAADVAALLNGLSLGNDFDGWKVVNFSATNDKIVWVEFGHDRVFFSVGIGAKGKGNPPPPIQTERYEVGYGMMRPKGATVPQDVLMKMAGEVSSRIRLRELEVAKPAAL